MGGRGCGQRSDNGWQGMVNDGQWWIADGSDGGGENKREEAQKIGDSGLFLKS